MKRKISDLKKQVSFLKLGMGGMFFIQLSTILGAIIYFRTR